MVKKIMSRIRWWVVVFQSRLIGNHHRNLTAVYVFALSSIAIMALVFQTFKFAIHSDQLSTVETIRSIERQVALVEKLYSKVVDAQITIEPDKSKKIEVRISKLKETLNSNHQKIFSGIDNDFCQTPSCWKHIESPFGNSRLFDGATLSPVVVEAALEKIKDYQKFLNEVSLVLDEKVKATTQSLIYLDISFLVLLLFVLVIQGFLGFRPAVQKLNEALSIRSDFISRISHEIRNPMNSIMGMADILKSTKLSAEQIQYVNNLQRSSHVLLDMLNNLVDFSGLESRSIQIKKSPFNLYKLVDQVTDVISIQAHDKGLELFVDMDPRIPNKLVGDGVRIEQVLLNFLNNALKFTSKGYILLSIQVSDSYSVEGEVCIEFKVKDTGIGIDSSKTKDIFLSFVQEDSSIKRRFGGSGLGLSICKEIVELMGSHIEVKSQKEEGAEFYFSLPFETDAVSNSPVFQGEGSALIYVSGLEDNTPILNYLESLSDNVIVVTNIYELEAVISDEDKDVYLLLDDSIGIVSMINSFGLVRSKVKAENIFALMRSNFSKENMELIRKNGFKNFLIKPFRSWHLREHTPIDKQWGYESDMGMIEGMNVEFKERNVSVLAVDDSNDNLFLLKEILNPITSNIDFSNNGLEACEQAKKKAYDIIFMDIQMPVMDGYTAITRIRKDDKKTPIFAVTAHAGLVEEKKCVEAGFTGRITKPINRDKIYTTMKEVFNMEIKEKESQANHPQDPLIIKLLPKYFETREEDLSIVKKAMNESDFQTIKKIGHRVKGSAKSYGFEEIGELSHKLEVAAENSDLDQCHQLIDTIDKKIHQAKREYNI